MATAWHGGLGEPETIPDREALDERDRSVLAMLDALALRKGVPLEPDERQAALLERVPRMARLVPSATTRVGRAPPPGVPSGRDDVTRFRPQASRATT